MEDGEAGCILSPHQAPSDVVEPPSPQEFHIWTPPAWTPLTATPRSPREGVNKTGGDAATQQKAESEAVPDDNSSSTTIAVCSEVPDKLIEVITSQEAMIESLMIRCRDLEALTVSQQRRLEEATEQRRLAEEQLYSQCSAFEIRTELKQLYSKLKMDLDHLKSSQEVAKEVKLASSSASKLQARSHLSISKPLASPSRNGPTPQSMSPAFRATSRSVTPLARPIRQAQTPQSCSTSSKRFSAFAAGCSALVREDLRRVECLSPPRGLRFPARSVSPPPLHRHMQRTPITPSKAALHGALKDQTGSMRSRLTTVRSPSPPLIRSVAR